MLATCQAGFEALLSRELNVLGCRETERGSGWIAGAAKAFPGNAESAFAHLILSDPVEIRGETVNALADAVLEAFTSSLQGERIEAPWPAVWQAAAGTTGLGKRAEAVRTRFNELLGRRLSRVAKLARPALPRAIGPVRGLFVWFCDFGRLWLAREAVVNGPRRMADDPKAPSRSYLKAEEAYLLLGREPAADETVCDLGAAPGGWSYSAAKRGARVTAVDHGPLKAGAQDHPNVRHIKADAFRFSPERGQRLDWLFCDMVEEPHHVLQDICRPWLENGWCRQFVVNLKFGRVDPIAFLAELRAPSSPFARAADCRIRHLYHDRDEFTVVGTLAG